MEKNSPFNSQEEFERAYDTVFSCSYKELQQRCKNAKEFIAVHPEYKALVNNSGDSLIGLIKIEKENDCSVITDCIDTLTLFTDFNLLKMDMSYTANTFRGIKIIENKN